MKTLDAKQLKMMMDGPTDVTVIDVLPEEKYEQRHVPGAINIPASDPSFAQKVEERIGDKSHPVVVYCANTECDLSPKAANALEAAGFANVYDFQGGIDEWTGQGYEAAGAARAT